MPAILQKTEPALENPVAVRSRSLLGVQVPFQQISAGMSYCDVGERKEQVECATFWVTLPSVWWLSWEILLRMVSFCR